MKFENRPGLKKFNLNLILTCNTFPLKGSLNLENKNDTSVTHLSVIKWINREIKNPIYSKIYGKH